MASRNNTQATLEMLSNFDIDAMLARIPNYAGVFSRDKLPVRPVNNKSECGVVNLDDDSGEGTHWVCYIVDPSLSCHFYFDSFGLAPPTEVVDYLHKMSPNKHIGFNNSQIQNITSILCGYYCVYVIKNFYKGKRGDDGLYDVLYSFDQKPDEFNEKKMIKTFA